jgi:hypothetical protein
MLVMSVSRPCDEAISHTVEVERIRKRFVERGLERAIRVYEQAVELTPPDSPELPGHLFNLGNGLSDRYTQMGQLVDMDAAINAFQYAV